MLTRDQLAIVKLAAEEDENIVSINGLLVTPGRTVATDGVILAMVSGHTAPAEQFPNFPGFEAADTFPAFILKRSDAISIAKAIPKGDSIWPIRHAAVNRLNTSEIAVNDLSTKQTFLFEPISGQFPKYDTVIPKKEEAAFVIRFDAKKLGEMMMLIAASSPVIAPVELRFYADREDGIPAGMRIDAVTREEQEWVGVLMPLRKLEG
jgi:DNA polymerase III sliding clamp (beta) subunit (PCNA family)